MSWRIFLRELFALKGRKSGGSSRGVVALKNCQWMYSYINTSTWTVGSDVVVTRSWGILWEERVERANSTECRYFLLAVIQPLIFKPTYQRQLGKSVVLLDLVLLHHAFRFRWRSSTVQIVVRWQVSWLWDFAEDPVVWIKCWHCILFFLTCCIKISKIHVYVSVSVGRDDCSDCSRWHFNICKQKSTFPIILINEKLGLATSWSLVSKPIQIICTLLSQHEIERQNPEVSTSSDLHLVCRNELCQCLIC